MTTEEMTAAAKAYMAAHPAPAPRSSNPPEQTVAERKAEMMALILRNYPELTREDVQGLLDSFF